MPSKPAKAARSSRPPKPAKRTTRLPIGPGWCIFLLLSLLVQERDRAEDRPDHEFVAHFRVDHQVKVCARRPFDIEVLLDILRAVPIHSLYQLERFVLAHALRP